LKFDGEIVNCVDYNFIGDYFWDWLRYRELSPPQNKYQTDWIIMWWGGDRLMIGGVIVGKTVIF
jgi:hypothetical protein